eukprot:CAMPEP_0173115596 /NCGR_PEP_ID=MMETSP1102-20130122/48618_1 /TAXON_ID=49646 /ORGANISM="Geminigera sp., Strain Caron Lab Isolate" /LENGTH=72 /DNA_ID=CAMNT_0014018709 /DNA_START=181 /DNA_END=395 /DNA_ORIENTATION=+
MFSVSSSLPERLLARAALVPPRAFSPGATPSRDSACALAKRGIDRGVAAKRNPLAAGDKKQAGSPDFSTEPG